jgi:hypothetical protein
MRARVALGAALLWLGWTAPGSGQQNAQAASARLLLLSPVPAAVEERIAGQIADLAWVSERVPGALEPDPLRAAAREAASKGARAVVWVTRAADGAYQLELYDPAKRRLLERRFALDKAEGALAESAALEALALAVRSALRALEADETVGETIVAKVDAGSIESGQKPSAGGQAATSAQTSKRGATSATNQTWAEERATQSASGAGSHAALLVAGGWDLALDGQSPVMHGPWACLGVALGPVELSAEAQTALATEVSDAQTTLSLQRKVALATAALELVRKDRLQLALGAGAGLASFARETTQVAAGLRATAGANSLALALGLELRGRIALLSGSLASFGLELAAGALVIPAAPVLRYQGSAGRVEHALWFIEPHVHLGPYLRLEL